MVGSSKCFLANMSKQQRVYRGECEYDHGGYFIVKGKERCLISQERMNHNIVYVFEQKPSQKYAMVAEIRSMSEETRHSVFVQMKNSSQQDCVANTFYSTRYTIRDCVSSVWSFDQGY